LGGLRKKGHLYNYNKIFYYNEVKLLYLILFIPVYSYSASNYKFRVGGGLYSKSLTGTQKSTSTEGKLISNSNLVTGLKLNYRYSKSVHFLFNYVSQDFSFDNTDSIIADESSFQVSTINIGARWIMLKRVAFRFMITSADDLAFTVDSNKKAVLYSESLKYLSLFYDQIVFMGSKMYSGFRFGYDLESSGSTISGRSGTMFTLFFNMGNFEVSYDLKNHTKENSTMDFVESDNSLNVTYAFSF
jgi:hypothetical protein